MMIPEDHPFRRIVSSQQPGMRFMRGLLIGLSMLAAFAGIGASLQPLLPPSVYQKDFLQEYLISKAALSGVNPYLPLPELASRFMGSLPVGVAPHPTPHPPPVVLISLPLGLLTYIQAAIVWYLIEFLCILFSTYLLLRWLGKQHSPGWIFVAFVVVFLWSAVIDELAVGQLNSLLMLCLIVAWLLLRKGKDTSGGLMVGMVIALKLIAWPICIFLLFRRKWRALAVAVSAVIVANLAAGIVIGFQQVINYYIHIAGSVTPYYLTFDRNFSTWTFGYRLFQGTYPQLTLGIIAPALISIPGIALAASIGFTLVFLLIGLWMALRAANFDAATGILVCVSILVNPVAWSHYLILTAIPLVLVVHHFITEKLTNKEIYLSIAIILFLFFSSGFRGLIFLFTRSDPTQIQTVNVSFLASLLTLSPAIAISALLWLVWRLEQLHTDPSI